MKIVSIENDIRKGQKTILEMAIMKLQLNNS